MNVEEYKNELIIDTILNRVAIILFLIQLVMFFLYYNFTTNIYALGYGWFLLIPSLILIIISVKDDSKGKEKLYKHVKFPIHFGWCIVSIALALITQQWFTSLIAIVFVSIMILDIRRISVLKQI